MQQRIDDTLELLSVYIKDQLSLPEAKAEVAFELTFKNTDSKPRPMKVKIDVMTPEKILSWVDHRFVVGIHEREVVTFRNELTSVALWNLSAPKIYNFQIHLYSHLDEELMSFGREWGFRSVKHRSNPISINGTDSITQYLNNGSHTLLGSEHTLESRINQIAHIKSDEYQAILLEEPLEDAFYEMLDHKGICALVTLPNPEETQVENITRLTQHPSVIGFVLPAHIHSRKSIKSWMTTYAPYTLGRVLVTTDHHKHLQGDLVLASEKTYLKWVKKNPDIFDEATILVNTGEDYQLAPIYEGREVKNLYDFDVSTNEGLDVKRPFDPSAGQEEAIEALRTIVGAVEIEDENSKRADPKEVPVDLVEQTEEDRVEETDVIEEEAIEEENEDLQVIVEEEIEETEEIEEDKAVESSEFIENQVDLVEQTEEVQEPFSTIEIVDAQPVIDEEPISKAYKERINYLKEWDLTIEENVLVPHKNSHFILHIEKAMELGLGYMVQQVTEDGDLDILEVINLKNLQEEIGPMCQIALWPHGLNTSSIYFNTIGFLMMDDVDTAMEEELKDMDFFDLSYPWLGLKQWRVGEMKFTRENEIPFDGKIFQTGEGVGVDLGPWTYRFSDGLLKQCYHHGKPLLAGPVEVVFYNHHETIAFRSKEEAHQAEDKRVSVVYQMSSHDQNQEQLLGYSISGDDSIDIITSLSPDLDRVTLTLTFKQPITGFTCIGEKILTLPQMTFGGQWFVDGDFMTKEDTNYFDVPYFSLTLEDDHEFFVQSSGPKMSVEVEEDNDGRGHRVKLNFEMDPKTCATQEQLRLIRMYMNQ